MIEEKRCFVYRGRAYGTREEAEEAVNNERRDVAVYRFLDWLQDNDYQSFGAAKKLESLGFFHDGAER